jgi:hypothetical protein
MNVFRQTAPKLQPWLIAVFPLVFWAALLLSLQAGNVRDILRPGGLRDFIQGLRAILPFIAVILAAVMVLGKLSRHRQGGLALFGPLGLTAIYGLVGVASALLSPDGSVALYWAAAYLSVPLVLWAIIWGTDALGSARRVIDFNWLIIILASAALFAVALAFLHLGSIIATPSLWLDCTLYDPWKGESWYALTSGVLRPTGVGRYAAIAGIIALGGMWQRGRWFLWGPALAASLILLLTSGARGAFVGFAGGAALVLLLYAGKKAIAAGALAVIVLVPLVWVTGVHQDFVAGCIRPPKEGVTQAEVKQLVSSQGDAGSQASPQLAGEYQSKRLVPPDVLGLSGRTAVWETGLDLFKESPFLGWGFHADRLLLGTHMHNTLLHALIQTGLIGTVPLVAGLVWAWVLQIKALRNRAQLPVVHRHLVIQVAGVLAFLSLRAIPESTGAFFGVDWLLLAPLLLYLQIVNQKRNQSSSAA